MHRDVMLQALRWPIKHVQAYISGNINAIFIHSLPGGRHDKR